MNIENPLIVTRHIGTVEWLSRQGITGEVKASVTPEEVAGRNIVGALPAHIAQYALSVTSIDYVCPFELRGKDLSADMLERLGARLFRYMVVPVLETEHPES